MFGLSKQERRLNAEMRAVEVLASLAQTAIVAAAEVRVAESQSTNSDVDALRSENRVLRMLLERYRKETPLANQPYMIAHQVDELLNRGGGAA